MANRSRVPQSHSTNVVESLGEYLQKWAQRRDQETLNIKAGNRFLDKALGMQQLYNQLHGNNPELDELLERLVDALPDIVRGRSTVSQTPPSRTQSRVVKPPRVAVTEPKVESPEVTPKPVRIKNGLKTLGVFPQVRMLLSSLWETEGKLPEFAFSSVYGEDWRIKRIAVILKGGLRESRTIEQDLKLGDESFFLQMVAATLMRLSQMKAGNLPGIPSQDLRALYDKLDYSRNEEAIISIVATWRAYLNESLV